MHIQEFTFDRRAFTFTRMQIACLAMFIAGASFLIATRVQAQACALDRVVDGTVTVADQIRALPPEGSAAPDPAGFTCQRVQGGISSARNSCVQRGCPDYSDADVLCCAAGVGGRPGEPNAAAAPSQAGGARSGGFVLPSCADEGDCELDDIIRTGVNFANFIFGLAGAIFLAIFIYSGVEYLIFAQNSSKVQAAKRRLVDAAIGMGFIIAAGVLASFVYEAFMSSGGGGGGITEDTCEAQNPGYSCTVLSVQGLEAEIQRRGCQRRLCTGGTNRVCCPSESAPAR